MQRHTVSSALDRPGATRLRWPRLAAQLRQLRVAVAVAEHGSTVRAAVALHLSQPAVTRAVQALEAACGIALFDRASRGMALTVPGERLAGRATTVFLHLAGGAADAVAAATADARPAGPAPRFAATVAPGALRSLVAISAQGSEAAAAAALGVTQPAVHHGLQALEHALGVRLFYRLSFGTRLTPAGEALLRRVQLALAEIEAMDGELALLRGEVRGRVVVGVLPLSATLFLPRAIDALLGRHPQVSIEIVDGTYESLLRQLTSANIDVIAGALRSGPPPDETLHHPLFADELVVVARSGHPALAARRRIADLLRWPWVVPLPETPAERVLDDLFRRHGLAPPAKTLRASSPSSTRALVLQTGRLALASRGEALQDDLGGELGIVRVDLPSTLRRIGLVTRAVGRPSHDLALLIEACREAVAALAGLRRSIDDAPTP